MLYRLRRHPIPVKAFFRHSLVLTYSFPEEVLTPLLPSGLSLDTHEGNGFVAIAMVQTEALRPSFLPRLCGCSFFLSGYRIFARYTTPEGRRLRGLRILRSDTNRRVMAFFGNRLTHYNYRLARVVMSHEEGRMSIEIRTPHAEADLRVIANVEDPCTRVPEGSPFASIEEARRFAGPLPFTFDYEPETHSIIRIQGHRETWNPQPVEVDVKELTYFDAAEFANTKPVLANAFYLRDIPYRWAKGVREPLQQ